MNCSQMLAILMKGNVAAVDVHSKFVGFGANDSWLEDDGQLLRAPHLALGVATQKLPQRQVTCLVTTHLLGRRALASTARQVIVKWSIE